MAKTASVHTRIDPTIKAEAVLSELGMKPAEAVQIFYRQIALRQAFPVELKIPNRETAQVLEESQAGIHVERFESKEALFKDLGL